MDMLWKRSKTKAELKSEVRFVLRIGRAFSIIIVFCWALTLVHRHFQLIIMLLGSVGYSRVRVSCTRQAKSCMQRNQIPWLLT